MCASFIARDGQGLPFVQLLTPAKLPASGIPRFVSPTSLSLSHTETDCVGKVPMNWVDFHGRLKTEREQVVAPGSTALRNFESNLYIVPVDMRNAFAVVNSERLL